MFHLILWITLIAVTLVVSFAAFYWALKNGQFDEQKRAAYFPLLDLPPETVQERPARRIAELYVFSFTAVTFFVAIFLAVLLGAGDA
ncbi:MAG: cbb3-type cytochrome oxidase assembly protein CcoS [Desulfobacteraceae bacterium]|nr:MAG: cbb3-type cytochrome oxidase assembly protein CcoS [Desulfobacteraceae bacterium]